MKFSRFVRKALVAASFIGMATSFGGESASAATESTSLDVDATVLSSCLISTAPVAFGTYDPMGANATAPLDNSAGEVRVTCANGLAVNVRLDQGASPGTGSTADAPIRRMAGTGAAAGDFLSYNLYTDTPGGTVWGDTAASGVDVAANGTMQTLLIHGRVPAGQNPQAGDYSDTVTASVWF